jgi:hypothetical protein
MSSETNPRVARGELVMSNDDAAAERRDGTTRRDAILRVSALFGGALVAQSALLAACTSFSSSARAQDYAPVTSVTADMHPGTVFTPEEVALLDEIAETILPETATPGAKAAGVGPFMAYMVMNAYSPQQQATFRSGMRTFEQEALRALGMPFMQAMPAQRLALLERLDREQFDYMRTPAAGAAPHYFRMMKELALLGYFTSEIGMTQAQRYVEAPGRFDPDVQYTPGERAWAAHA